MIFFVLIVVLSSTRSQDIHIHEWPLRIRILWGHSHPLKDAAVLRYRDVNPATRHRILQLFDQGYSNNTVINLLMYELVQSKEKAHALGPKDRSIMPDFSYINRLGFSFYINNMNSHRIASKSLLNSKLGHNLQIR